MKSTHLLHTGPIGQYSSSETVAMLKVIIIVIQFIGIGHCNIPKVVSYAKWWYGIFQYHTTIHPISYHYLNSGMILENTIPPFAIRKRQSS